MLRNIQKERTLYAIDLDFLPDDSGKEGFGRILRVSCRIGDWLLIVKKHIQITNGIYVSVDIQTIFTFHRFPSRASF